MNWPHLCVGQGDEHDPAVVGVAFALDPPALLEALDEQRHRRLGQALELCELGDTPRRIGQRPGHPGFGARHIGPNLPDEQARIATALSVIIGSASGGVAGAVMQSFTDLADGLPGIGTNILTNRLAGLQEQGVGEKRTLPRPTPVAVYELTDAGTQVRATRRRRLVQPHRHRRRRRRQGGNRGDAEAVMTIEPRLFLRLANEIVAMLAGSAR